MRVCKKIYLKTGVDKLNLRVLKMHELSICKSIIKQLETHLATQPALRITKIYLSIGTFSCVDFESLKFNFLLLCKNTVFENTELDYYEIPALAYCQNCNSEYQPCTLYSFCPSCGHADTKLISGNELLIKNIEVR